MTEEEIMRHDAITQYLDAEADLHEAERLLNDLEPSSGARAALEAKVAELRQTAVSHAVPAMPARIEHAPVLVAPLRNGRRALCGCLVSISLLFGAYEFASAVLRRFE